MKYTVNVHNPLKVALIWIVSGVIITLIIISVLYYQDISQSYDRIQDKAKVISSPYGDIEFIERGSGQPVLVIHGGGGGYDQGELIAQTVLDDRFRRIIPSRFGYLGSTLPVGATWDQQAHAYAWLLDHLNIDKVAVVAMSQGGPSALLFAVLHSERVSSLTCLSCGVTPSTSAAQEAANLKGRMLKLLFRYDPIYWTVTTLFRSQFMSILGVSPEVTADLTLQQREAVNRFIDEMNPVSPRSAGATFDNEATMPGKRIASISTPTLLIHAKDDTLQLFDNATFAAAMVPGARLMSFDRGGHVVMIVEQEIIRLHVQQHILANTGP